MNKITITLTSAEIETLIYGCMASTSYYCHEENETLPYRELIRKLEAASKHIGNNVLNHTGTNE